MAHRAAGEDLRRARGVRWALWAAALHIGMALGYVGLAAAAIRQGMIWRADFTARYTGARLVWEGQGADLYDRETQARWQQALLGGRTLADGLLPYNHPPHTALLLAPLAALPLEAAFAAWTLANLGLGAALALDLTRFARPWRRAERALVLTTFAALPGLLLSFLLGAFSLWATVALWGFYRALKGRRAVTAAAWLVFGSIHPHFFLFPVLTLAAGRRWRALGAWAAGMLALFGWAAWRLGPTVGWGWLAMLRWSASAFGEGGIDPRAMANLKGLLTHALGPSQAAAVNLLAALALMGAAAAVFGIWRGTWAPERADFEARMALTLALGQLTNLHVHPQDTLLLFVPGLLLYTALRAQGRGRAFGAMAVLFPPVGLAATFGGAGGPCGALAALALAIGAAGALRVGEGSRREG